MKISTFAEYQNSRSCVVKIIGKTERWILYLKRFEMFLHFVIKIFYINHQKENIPNLRHTA